MKVAINDVQKAQTHGEEFAALQLEMVRHFLGEQDYLELRAAFVEHRVKHHGRQQQLVGKAADWKQLRLPFSS